MRTTVPAKDGRRAGDPLDRDFTAIAPASWCGAVDGLQRDGTEVEKQVPTRAGRQVSDQGVWTRCRISVATADAVIDQVGLE